MSVKFVFEVDTSPITAMLNFVLLCNDNTKKVLK